MGARMRLLDCSAITLPQLLAVVHPIYACFQGGSQKLHLRVGEPRHFFYATFQDRPQELHLYVGEPHQHPVLAGKMWKYLLIESLTG